MRTSKVGIVAAAILMAVAGVGFGIAQAGAPVLSFEDQESPQAAISQADDMQLENPTETGSFPTESYADSSKAESEGYVERVWKGDIDGH